MVMRLSLIAIVTLTALSLSGCSTLYYNAMEKLGKEKRDILVSRIKDAREDQEEAKEQFVSALDQFQAVIGYDGGNLEKQYRKLNGEYEDCESRAKRVRDRIESIENVAGALFKEWENELDQYQNASLRQSSEQSLRETKRRYNDMIAAMQRASDKMDPVLRAFHDQVLFLKHNLNAQAVASLEGELALIEDDVAVLIADMEQSIAEAESFLADMEGRS